MKDRGRELMFCVPLLAAMGFLLSRSDRGELHGLGVLACALALLALATGRRVWLHLRVMAVSFLAWLLLLLFVGQLGWGPGGALWLLAMLLAASLVLGQLQRRRATP